MVLECWVCGEVMYSVRLTLENSYLPDNFSGVMVFCEIRSIPVVFLLHLINIS